MKDETVIEETKRFLIEQKVSFINAAVNAAMLWWVSSILFCGSALAAVWSNKDKIQESTGILVGLGIVLFVFFGAIAIFGFLGAYRLCIVQSEIAALAGKLKYTEAVKPDLQSGFFSTEILTYKIAMIVGGGSFALIHIVWFIFWLYMLGLGVYSCAIGGIVVVVFWLFLGTLFWRKDRKEIQK